MIVGIGLSGGAANDMYGNRLHTEEATMIDETSAATAALQSKSGSTPSIIRLGRVLDEQSAEELMNQVRERAESGLLYLVFDCANLEYITSFGLSVFLRARKIMRKKFGDSTEIPLHTDSHPVGSNGEKTNGEIDPGSTRIRLAGVQPNVMGILRTACLLQILPVYHDVESAQANLL